MRTPCVATLALLLPLLLTQSFRVRPRGRKIVVGKPASAAAPEEAGLASDAAGAEPNSDKPAGIPNSNAAWTVPRRETEFENSGPYDEITRCRQELAASFPGSLWRNSTTPKYQMEAVLDIPATLTWKGVTNNCSSPYRVNVYYPVGASGRVPLISFAHGFGNGGDVLDERNRERIYKPLVEEGFFVIAYQFFVIEYLYLCTPYLFFVIACAYVWSG